MFLFAEEVERLEKALEKKTVETEELKNKQTKFLEEIKNQDKLNKSLKEEAMLQKQSCEELESDLSTKNKLVSLCYTLLWLCSVKVERRLMLKHNILTGASGRWPKALGIVVDCDNVICYPKV